MQREQSLQPRLTPLAVASGWLELNVSSANEENRYWPRREVTIGAGPRLSAKLDCQNFRPVEGAEPASFRFSTNGDDVI